MAIGRGIFVVRNFNMRTLNFSTSSTDYNKWRREQGLEPNPQKFGPLTNLPDYSFLDGRPTPLGYFKKMKVEHQQNLCKKIAELTHEMDVGLEQYYKNLEGKKQEREGILRSKLKPKGVALLKAKNQSGS